MDFWSGKKILVTGGGGFIGSHLVERLLRYNSDIRIVGRSKIPEHSPKCPKKIEYIRADLSNLNNCLKVVQGVDIVFNLASNVAGIGYNISHHANMFQNNTLLNLYMLEASKRENVERYMCTSSTCVYPRKCKIPTPETEGFKDDPEPTVLGYGWAKRVAEIQAKLYAKDYEMNIAIIRPTNTYGPRDNFDPDLSHVIPALIRKIHKLKDSVTIWGSGTQTRSFIYVEDLASAMMEVTEKYAVADPINIGTEEEITIKKLAHLILEHTGKDLKLIFDVTKPEGQPRKIADITKAKEILEWRPVYSLKEGLNKTIKYYQNNVK